MNRDYFVLGHGYHWSRGVVLLAMREYVNVLCVEYFCEPTMELRMKMVLDWERWRGELVWGTGIGTESASRF